MSIKNRIDKASDNMLENLFAQARAEQTDYRDDNFTKIVLNGLPSKSHRVVRNKRTYTDLIGLTIGLVVTYLVVEPAQIFNGLVGLLPSNISISFMSMLIVSLSFSALALTALWSVESKSQI